MAHNPQNMPYIYHSGNGYTYGENLQRLFTDIVRNPFENHPPTRAWVDEVVRKDVDYHRKDILDQGRTNFDKPFNDGLSPEDKVLLYCRYYMPMHLISSYHIFVHTPYFSDSVTSASERIVFIDFGCGPLTSGIAFWAFAQQSNTIYLGIDSSQAMRKKARRINHYGPNHDGDSFFSRYVLLSSYTDLPELLDNTIMRGDRTPIIFNLCYFLASRRLNVSALSDVMVQIIERYSNHEMCIVYQNPPNYPSLHKNWNILKTHLPGFRSQISQSNTQYFDYDRLNDGSRRYNASVYYDMLFNNLDSTKGGQTNDTTQPLIPF